LIQLQADLPAGLKTWLIKDTDFTIGRSADCLIQLEHFSVSKIHARVRWQAGAYSLHDEGSSNGSWVDGQSFSSIRFDDAIMVMFGTLECNLRILDPLFGSDHFGRFRVATASVRVGRSAGNDWVIDHPTASGEHFILQKHESSVLLLNVSRQGTRVGGLPIDETVLAVGDEITIGDVKLVYLKAPLVEVAAVFDPPQVTGKNAVFRASISGALARDQVTALAAYLDAAVASGASTIELEMGRCSAMHPHALDVLVATARKCESSTRGLVLLNPAPPVVRAVALANASQWLTISRSPR
jgi:pSer/pThr/pTyr-binding forkhead associated (FHA) protein